MEVTKKEVLELLGKVGIMENVVSQTDTKFILNDELSFCFLRARDSTEQVSKSQEKVIEFLKKEFKVKKKIKKEDEDVKDEDIDSKELNTYVEESERYKKFLDEKVEINFYKIKIDDLKGVKLPGFTAMLMSLKPYLFEK
jgi:hypothetical protein